MEVTRICINGDIITVRAISTECCVSGCGKIVYAEYEAREIIGVCMTHQTFGKLCQRAAARKK